MAVCDEPVKLWKEAIVTLFKVICLEKLKKATQNSQDSGVLVGILSGYMPNTSQIYLLFEPSCSATVFEKPTGPQVVKKKNPAVFVKRYSLSFSQDTRVSRAG